MNRKAGGPVASHGSAPSQAARGKGPTGAGVRPGGALSDDHALRRAGKPARRPRPNCFHCGAICRATLVSVQDKTFCCQGCRAVFELLMENGLGDFYNLAERSGIPVGPGEAADFHYLDDLVNRERLVDFSDARLTRVTFRLPAIHCIACVWLLENLFRLKEGIGQSRVNFARKEIAISFATGRLQLSELAGLLASLGYEPELKLSDLGNRRKNPAPQRLWLQIGVAGFAFGNTMLFSLASYLGLDAFSGPAFRKLVGLISFLLAIPVVGYSAVDYWRSAWLSLRQARLTIDVPIAAGIVALFGQSAWEVLSGRGEGYFDSLAGLLFFLLCGKLFQQKTYDRLAFDRDYQSFFPLSVTRKISVPQLPIALFPSMGHEEGRGAPLPAPNRREERVSLDQLRVGDRLIIRHGELIPADARLVAGPAVVDYSFVSGESEPAGKQAGDHLYAGGRQVGGAIEVETVKAVSQSYLTSLWNQEAFRKENETSLDTLTDRYSQRFTKLVVLIAVSAALFWCVAEPTRSIKAFTSVLIVACPCALALAAPFTLGTGLRLLGRRRIFLKNTQCLEALARVDTVVFDKTGTLTTPGHGLVAFHGEPLSETEAHWLYSLTRHSTHPLAARIGGSFPTEPSEEAVSSFRERPGCGMEGRVAGHEIWMGSAAWLESRGCPTAAAAPLEVPAATIAASRAKRAETYESGPPEGRASAGPGSAVHVALDGHYRGCFVLGNAVRPETERLMRELSSRCALALLSGDNERERGRFAELFKSDSDLHFHQSPLDKLGFIRRLRESGRTVMMVGDGLNDAGALKQSDVGVAVVENINGFSPASDVILAGEQVPQLGRLLCYAKGAVRIVQASFLLSALYNLVGIGIAVRGVLSPVICAILMPLSSVTVVAFAVGMAGWLGLRTFRCHGVPGEGSLTAIPGEASCLGPIAGGQIRP